MSALAGHTGLHILGVQLAFRQVREADADGGQGLGVIRLHDVAQEPQPELLGWGEGGMIGWGICTHMRRSIGLTPGL